MVSSLATADLSVDSKHIVKFETDLKGPCAKQNDAIFRPIKCWNPPLDELVDVIIVKVLVPPNRKGAGIYAVKPYRSVQYGRGIAESLSAAGCNNS